MPATSLARDSAPRVARELMRACGRRVSERDVPAVRVIASEPELGNNDIAGRGGLQAGGHAPAVGRRDPQRVSCLKRARGHLTPTGEQLEAAIRNHRTTA
jgi:hypothetical protein